MLINGFRRLFLSCPIPIQRFSYPQLQLNVRTFAKGSMKTNKSAAKRFRVKGNGDLKRQRSGKGHNTGYLTRSRKNRLSTSTEINGKKIEKNMKRVLRSS